MKPETLQDLINREAESLFLSFHTKAPEWNGEQEWRFDLTLAEVENNLIDFDFATAVYLGEKIGDEWKHKLIDIAKEQKLDVYQRKLDEMKSNWIYEKNPYNKNGLAFELLIQGQGFLSAQVR